MVMTFPITEHVTKSARHTSFYLSCGAADAPPIIFVHGWPELSISWRHQLPVFAALGFRAIAPDMRGYGRSGVYARHEDYCLEEIVADMRELLASLGHDKAIWVGHDWGAPVVWSIASHYPELCHGVANLCVPYFSAGFTPKNFIPFVDRTTYPEDRYPWGQWEYMAFYEENFPKACAAMEVDVLATVRALFRKGSPDSVGKPSRTATTRNDGAWFGGLGRAPEVPLDRDVLSEEDMYRYAAALQRNGFFGPDSWYMNHARNGIYAQQRQNEGKLVMPVLFFHGAYDTTCETMVSRLAEPMRADCADLTEIVVKSGHWMAQEKPVDVNAGLARWLAVKFPGLWPQ